MAEAKLLIPRLKVSESTLQYYKPKSGPPLFYKPRFQLSKETYNKTLGQLWLTRKDPLMPAYPYLGNPNRFPEANHGLYGGVTIQSGNKISKGRNKGKTLRKWFPNVKVETLRSQALKRTLTIPVTTRVKRTIAKCGGIDEYLLGNKPARIKELGLLGWKLRWHVMNSDMMRQKFLEKQKNAEHPFDKTFEEAWSDEKTRQKLVAQQMTNWEKLREKDVRFVQHMKTRVVADKASAKAIRLDQIRTLTLDPEVLGLPDAVQEEGLTEEEQMLEERRRLRMAKQEETKKLKRKTTSADEPENAGSLNDMAALAEAEAEPVDPDSEVESSAVLESGEIPQKDGKIGEQ